jgi:hypothetical protein
MDLPSWSRCWEVVLTLRVKTGHAEKAWTQTPESVPDFDLLDRIGDALLKHSNVDGVTVWGPVDVVSGGEGISAAIAFVEVSTPGAAVDEAIALLAEACAASGLMPDEIDEVCASRPNWLLSTSGDAIKQRGRASDGVRGRSSPGRSSGV